jgi:small subunit ribosomal protein S11
MATETKKPTAPAAAGSGTTKAPRKKKVKRAFTKGVAHVHATFNNTIITITDEQGNAIAWSSAVP